MSWCGSSMVEGLEEATRDARSGSMLINTKPSVRCAWRALLQRHMWSVSMENRCMLAIAAAETRYEERRNRVHSAACRLFGISNGNAGWNNKRRLLRLHASRIPVGTKGC